MKGIGVVALREIAEKRMVLVAGSVAGLITALIPVIFRTSFDSVESRGMLVLCGALSFGGGAAILFGASTLARELKEKRLPFFFSRPLSPFVIWGGKLSGVMVLAVSMAVLCALPSVLVELPRASSGWVFLALVGVLICLTVLSDVVSAALRSRSPWIVIDLVLLASVAVAVVWVFRKLFGEGWWGFGTPTPAFFAGAIGIPLLILLTASYARVAIGRTDIRRAHGAQSVVLWALALPATAALVGFTIWLILPTPSALIDTTHRVTARRGGWEVVSGPLRHRGYVTVAFLRNPERKEYLRLHRHWPHAYSFSEGGLRVAWSEYMGRKEGTTTNENPYEIVVVDLAKTPLRVQRTGLFFDYGLRPALSENGTRLAAINSSLLTVYEIADPTLPTSLVNVRLPASVFPAVSFSGNDKVLLAPPNEVLRNPRDEARRLAHPRYILDIPTKTISRLPPAAP